MELWQISRIISSRLCTLHQNPDCAKVPKSDFANDLILCSNLICCVAFGLHSPIIVSIWSSTFVVKESIEKFLFLILPSKCWYYEDALKLFLNTSILKIVFLWVLIPWFLPSRSQSEFHNFWQTFRLKSCRLFSLQQKPDGRKNPKGAMFFDLTRCSNSVFSEATGSICRIKTPSDFFGTVTNQSNKK